MVRHGETTGDVEDRYGGDYDDHLTEKGRKQAEELAKKLSNKGIEIIFCSPRIRAKETLEIINKKLKVLSKIVQGFREGNKYGILTGMKKSDAREKYPDQIILIEKRMKVKGGEDYDVFRKRIFDAFEKVTNSGYNKIAIITHGGPIENICKKYLNLNKLKSEEIEDCAIIKIEKENKKYKLIK